MRGSENYKAEHVFADPPYTQGSAESDQELRLRSPTTQEKHPAPSLLFVLALTPLVLRHSDTIGDRVPSFTHVNFLTLQSHISHIGSRLPSNKGNTTLPVDSEVHEEE